MNPKGLYMVNEETSHQHVQSITTLRSEKLVDNQVENKKDEHTEVSETLQKDKGKQVINETSTSADPSSETPYVPSPIPRMAQGTFSLWKTRRENTSNDGGVQTSEDQHSPP
jgi:hypothetical protein